MRILTISIIILMLMPLASAYNIVLTLKDSSTHEPISGPIVYSIYTENRLIKESNYFLANGTIYLNLNAGEYDVEFKYDSIATTGKDLYSRMTFDIHDDLSLDIYMLPVGSIQGIVLDNKGRFVANATITADCVAEYGIQGTNYTNHMGTFSYNYIPIRNCRIIAKSGGMIGFADVSVNKGELEQITVTLDKNIQKTTRIWAIVIGILIALAITYIILHKHKKIISKKTETMTNTHRQTHKEHYKDSEKTVEKKSVPTNQRSADILRTLKGRERQIVQYVIDNGAVSMSKIYYGTGIPKTSLVRILDNLESRNILRMEKLGKMKKVDLTDWFKGK